MEPFLDPQRRRGRLDDGAAGEMGTVTPRVSRERMEGEREMRGG